MWLAYFKIRYAKARMVAYVHGELPSAARRRIARYIEQYPACYAEYVKQRSAMRELEWKLPLIGQAERPTLDRMWSAIQAGLETSTDAHTGALPPVRGRTARRFTRPGFQLRYGVAGLAMACAIVLPMTFTGNRAAFAAIRSLSLSQPAPQTATSQPPRDATIAAGFRNVGLDSERIIVMLVATEQVTAQMGVDVTVTPPAPAMPHATPAATDED
jgi:anti-sigma factor RsiW